MAPRLKWIIGIIILGLIGLPLKATAGSRYNSTTGSKDFCITVRDESGDVVNEKCNDVYVDDGSLEQVGTGKDAYYILRTQISGTSGTSVYTTLQTALSGSYTYIRKSIASDAAFSTGTLSDGRAGQLITIEITAVSGNGTFTLTPTTKTGFTSLVFEAVGDIQTLLYVDDTVGWIRLTSESVQKN